MKHRKKPKRRAFRRRFVLQSFRGSPNLRRCDLITSGWRIISELEFAKPIMRDVERIWLNLFAPDAKITYRFVENYKNMPLYRKGKWNGKAYFVTFEEKDVLKAMNFRVSWWDFNE
jgi:hypothetical protein